MKQESLVEPQVFPESKSVQDSSTAERRQHQRLPVSVDVEIVDIKSGVHIAGRVSDFGIGGCYVDTLNTLPQGTPVDVFLNWQSRKLRVRALVSYTETGRSIGMGLSFLGTSDEAGASLLDWVTGLSNEPPEDIPQPQKAESPIDQPAPQSLSTQGARKAVRELLVVLQRKSVLSQPEVTQLLRLLEAATNPEPDR